MKNLIRNALGLRKSVSELIPCLSLGMVVKAVLLAFFTRALVKTPSRRYWIWLALLIIGSSALEALSIIYPKKSLFYPEVTRTTNDRLALTFDDGPSADITPRILDLLKKYNARGTFFVLGDCVKMHPDMLRRIVEEGHSIGIHSDFHNAMLLPNPEILFNRIESCRAAIGDAIGDTEPICLFRPPYGYRNAATHSAAKRAGVTVVMWAVDSMDYMLRPAHEIAGKVLKEIRPGDVILMHDGSRNVMSPDALELILQEMLRRGYTSAAM